MKSAALIMAAALLVGCASQDRLTTVDTRSENVGHQRLQPQAGSGGGQSQVYSLGARRLPDAPAVRGTRPGGWRS